MIPHHREPSSPPASRHRAAALNAWTLWIAFACMTGCSTEMRTWRDWVNHHGNEPATAPAPDWAAIDRRGDEPPSVVYAPDHGKFDGAVAGEGFDLSMRNPDFPATHINTIHIDLTGPDCRVHLRWSGNDIARAPTGPWRSTPGRGQGGFDCDDVTDSNTIDSFCTPKGTFLVAGFADRLRLTPQCTYVTWILHAPRFIAMHGHHDLPRKPASSGCVRLPVEAAKLIHNNSVAGVTKVVIEGKWTKPE